MLATRESISEFIKAQAASALTGITTPDMRFAVRSQLQAPEFPNCVNLVFYDDTTPPTIDPMYPHWRTLTATLDVYVETDANNPLVTEAQLLRVLAKIDGFMKVQSIAKNDYTSGSPVPTGSYITWRESYPLDWDSAMDAEGRYLLRTATIVFRYFEEAN